MQRGEFLTSYTPYQAEISQGTLTAIFEFQTLMCQLTGQEVANASMYDGSTALTEAVLMAERLTGRHRVLVARSVHPEYRQVLATYAKNLGLKSKRSDTRLPAKWNAARLRMKNSPNAAAVDRAVAEFLRRAGRAACARGSRARSRGAVRHLRYGSRSRWESFGPLRKPTSSRWKVRPSAFRPATAARMWASSPRARNLCGKCRAALRDKPPMRQGRRGFVLTLATREQHIRREKATSNICTNEALYALVATIHLCLLGKEGLREMALQNFAKARFAHGRTRKNSRRAARVLRPVRSMSSRLNFRVR